MTLYLRCGWTGRRGGVLQIEISVCHVLCSATDIPEYHHGGSRLPAQLSFLPFSISRTFSLKLWTRAACLCRALVQFVFGRWGGKQQVLRICSKHEFYHNQSSAEGNRWNILGVIFKLVLLWNVSVKHYSSTFREYFDVEITLSTGWM